jgi:hypothetical protein
MVVDLRWNRIITLVTVVVHSPCMVGCKDNSRGVVVECTAEVGEVVIEVVAGDPTIASVVVVEEVYPRHPSYEPLVLVSPSPPSLD